MNDAWRDHAPYDELAAGHALRALDADDEQHFLGHLPDCPRCQQALADYAEVAAALADTAPAAEPGQQLGDRIMAAALADRSRGSGGGPASPPTVIDDDGQAGQPRSGVTSLDKRRRPRRQQLAAAAAAAVLVAGGGIWAGLSAAGGGAQPPAAGCVRAHQCYQVQLTDAAVRGPVAKVIVSGGSVWLIPSRLPADNTSRQVYVLWQITGAHIPLAVGSFDIGRHAGSPIRIGRLAAAYRGTLAFAVSLEHGRTIPAGPSRLVALGQVAA